MAEWANVPSAPTAACDNYHKVSASWHSQKNRCFTNLSAYIKPAASGKFTSATTASEVQAAFLSLCEYSHREFHIHFLEQLHPTPLLHFFIFSLIFKFFLVQMHELTLRRVFEDCTFTLLTFLGSPQCFNLILDILKNPHKYLRARLFCKSSERKLAENTNYGRLWDNSYGSFCLSQFNSNFLKSLKEQVYLIILEQNRTVEKKLSRILAPKKIPPNLNSSSTTLELFCHLVIAPEVQISSILYQNPLCLYSKAEAWVKKISLAIQSETAQVRDSFSPLFLPKKKPSIYYYFFVGDGLRA